MLPALVAQVQDLAPRLRFQIVHAQNQDYAETWPRAGWISRWVMWKTWPSPLPASSFDWLTDHYVVIASRDHPRIRSAPSLDAYWPSATWRCAPEAGGHIDKLLERRGLRRDVAVQLPSVLAAPFIVAGSALIMTAPRRARTLGAVASIVEYPPPFEIPLHAEGLQPRAPAQRGACLAARTAAARDSALIGRLPLGHWQF